MARQSNTNKTEDGRVGLLKQMKAHANLTSLSKKTDPTTRAFAAELEVEIAGRIAALQSVLKKAA